MSAYELGFLHGKMIQSAEIDEMMDRLEITMVTGETFVVECEVLRVYFDGERVRKGSPTP